MSSTTGRVSLPWSTSDRPPRREQPAKAARPTAPRIRPGRLRDTGPAVQAFARLAGRVTGTTPPGVFLTLGRHRRLFWGWLLFAGAMMPGGRLPRRETELVILRVAALTGSAYELTQHRQLGRRAGLTPDEIEATRLGPSHPAWEPRERLLLRAADLLVQSRDLPDALWSQLRAELDDRELIELVMLVGHYSMLATTLHTLRVQPDRVR